MHQQPSPPLQRASWYEGRHTLHWLPIAWAAAWVMALGLVFFTTPWPYVDVVNVLGEASRWDWPAYLRNAVSRDVEYRPLFTIAVKAAYQVVGLRLWWYQGLVLLQFAAALALLIWILRPSGWRRGVAAAIAVSCVVGLHSTRILFGFWPLNHHSGGLVLLLTAVALALDERTRRIEWVYVPLTLVALLLLESGVIIAPLLAVLWWARAPGVRLRGVAAAAAGVAVYLVTRLTLGVVDDSLEVYTSSGLGFSDANPETLRRIFEHAPWLFWSYNVVASLLTVLVSEPRAGKYRFLASLLDGATPWYLWLQVGTSLLTTGVVAIVLARRGPSSPRDRLLLVVGLVLLLCGSALGFLYTRDRIALSAGVGYAILLYVGLTALLESRPGGWRRSLALCGITLIAAGWLVRSGETWYQLRDGAWDFHLEWTDRFAELGGRRSETELVQALRSASLGSTPADPRRDPKWTYVIFERRFTPDGVTTAGTPDTRADTVERPPSTPFDIRWKPEVDEAARRLLESELGLLAVERVERDLSGRTWTYRLEQPTRDRVRAILLNPGVEDTARIDAARFEVLR